MATQKALTLIDGKKTVLPSGDLLEGPFLIPYQHIKNNTPISTTSAAYVLLTGAQFITPVAGTYLLTVNVYVTLSNSSTNFTMALFVGGSLLVDTDRQIFRGGNQFNNVRNLYTITTPITVNGAQNVEVRWFRSAGTATKRNMDLTLLRVG